MSKQHKKQSFLAGAAILAAGNLIVKGIGFFYKIPLSNILGSEGKSHFTVAYNIYNLLLSISTAGLPLAISKLTSEAYALGKENEKRKIFRTAIWLFVVIGLAGFLLVFCGADQLAVLMEDELASLAIRSLAPAVFCVCLLSCMRGYTQGQGNMLPTAESQILEALFKLGIGLPLAWYVLQIGFGVEVSAAGAILGVTAGTVVSMLFLMGYLACHRSAGVSRDVPSGSGTIIKKVLSIGIPITISNSAMAIITLVDNKIVLGQLKSISGFLSDTPLAPNGQYTMAMDLVNLPASFVYPVSMSLLPFVAAALARRDHEGAARTVSSAFRLIALLALPCGVGLSVLSTPICVLLYPMQYEDALAAGPHLRILGLVCIFICIMSLTNAILQSYGKEMLPIFTVIVGGLTKIILNYFLVGNPDINIQGAPVASFCCYLVIAALNMFFVWKYSPVKPRYIQMFAKPALASALMGGAAWATWGFLDRALSGGMSGYMANAVATMGGIAAGVAVYFILVIALRILRAEDVKNIKKGDAIIRILHLK